VRVPEKVLLQQSGLLRQERHKPVGGGTLDLDLEWMSRALVVLVL
jgi:hypothetical protein